jgi:hypothetical protein
MSMWMNAARLGASRAVLSAAPRLAVGRTGAVAAWNQSEYFWKRLDFECLVRHCVGGKGNGRYL